MFNGTIRMQVFLGRLKASRTGASGDDAHVAKPGELSPEALVRVNAIRKAGLTDLD
jgi:hypothetical protein